jgi:hypothetical protein
LPIRRHGVRGGVRRHIGGEKSGAGAIADGLIRSGGKSDRHDRIPVLRCGGIHRTAKELPGPGQRGIVETRTTRVQRADRRGRIGSGGESLIRRGKIKNDRGKFLLGESQLGAAIGGHRDGSVGDPGDWRRTAGGILLHVIEGEGSIAGCRERPDRRGRYSIRLFTLEGHHAWAVERGQTEIIRRRLQFGDAAVNHIVGRVDADENELGGVDDVGHVGGRSIVARDDRTEREPSIGNGFIAQRVGSGNRFGGLQIPGVIDVHLAAVHKISRAVENRQADGGLRIAVLRDSGE